MLLSRKFYHFWVLIVMFALGLVLSLAMADLALSAESASSPPVQMDYEQKNDASQTESLGTVHYEAGEYTEAITHWQIAQEGYRTTGDNLDQARVMGLLALAYQQLGIWPQAQQAIEQTWLLLPDNAQTSPDPGRLPVYAQLLNNQGSLQLAQGQPEQALDSWQQAEALYLEINDHAGKIRSQINQAQALQALGFYQRATVQLQSVTAELVHEPESVLQAVALRRLGDLYFLLGQLEASQQVMEKGLTLAKSLQVNDEIAQMLMGLGKIAREQERLDQALDYYGQALALNPSPNITISNQLAQLDMLAKQGKWRQVDRLWPQIKMALDSTPPSRTSIYNRIYASKTLMGLKDGKKAASAIDRMDIVQVLLQAIHQSQEIADRRAESYALGYLGKVYEQSQQWADADQLTEQALSLARSLQAHDIEYQWQWQLGRLLAAQGKGEDAIAHYTHAIDLLSDLRGDLVAIGSEVQFSFRESVEPIYRELASLLLPADAEELISQQHLEQARDVIESLQLAELDNFFKEACLDVVPVQIDQIDEQAAVFYPILLKDRLEVILRLPHQPLRHFTVNVSDQDVEKLVNQLRETLVIRSRRQYLTPAKQLYDWLIRPIAADLENSQVDTLVFVLDGALQNVPMSVLHNGDHFLVEDFSLALTPGLKLMSHQPVNQEDIKVLVAGLTESRQGFSPLNHVTSEVQAIKDSATQSAILLDDSFTQDSLEEELQSQTFPIVHIATHGKFSSTAEDTFLLAWDKRINVSELDHTLQTSTSLREQAIDLLVLSACETATGDKRAALGLAGTAINAGARSTLATLWSINDQATAELIGNFYQALTQTDTTRAAALRQAQLQFLQNPQYRHPIYWAPYVLLGNWL